MNFTAGIGQGLVLFLSQRPCHFIFCDGAECRQLAIRIRRVWALADCAKLAARLALRRQPLPRLPRPTQ